MDFERTKEAPTASETIAPCAEASTQMQVTVDLLPFGNKWLGQVEQSDEERVAKNSESGLRARGLSVRQSMTTPTRPGKAPRPVWLVCGQTDGFEAMFRELGGRKWRGEWSFWEDPTDDILAHQGDRMSVAETEEYKARRKLEKSERYAGYAANAAARSRAACRQSQAICDRIPFGQPILVGHHSEGAARADQRRINNAMRRSINEGKKADYLEGQAAALQRDAKHLKSLEYIGNRIDEVKAEIRRINAWIEGRHYVNGPVTSTPSAEYIATKRAQLTRAEEKLAHWEAEKAKRAETCVLPSPETVKKGMWVMIPWGARREVLRVNAKSVTVRDFWSSEHEARGDFHTRTIPYKKIKAFGEYGAARAKDAVELVATVEEATPRSPEVAEQQENVEDVCTECDAEKIFKDGAMGATKLELLRRVVAERQACSIEGILVDMTTASAVVQVYDALSITNQTKLLSLPLGRMIDTVWKLMK